MQKLTSETTHATQQEAVQSNPSESIENNFEPMEFFLARKQISLDGFYNDPITLSDHISVHSAWAFRNIFALRYPKVALRDKIARFHHGIMHANRTAIYVNVVINFFRKAGDQDALALTKEDAKLLQIGALFHDAGREGEGPDLWDEDSALLCFYYLTQVLKIDIKIAKVIAEAIINKDQHDSHYRQLLVNERGDAKFVATHASQKTISQKIIHDVDCFDVMRRRPHFEAEHLDFYLEFAEFNYDYLALTAIFICEVRRLINLQGDTFEREDSAVKFCYENENGFVQTQELISKNTFKLLNSYGKRLYNAHELAVMSCEEFSYDPARRMSPVNANAAMLEGRLLARGIATPSAISPKHGEYFATTEIYKQARRVNVATRSKQKPSLLKHGNPKRSVVLLGYSSGIYACAGFLSLNPDIDKIRAIAAGNIASGRGKKKEWDPSVEVLDRYTKIKQFAALKRRLMMGGSSVLYGSYFVTHPEILYDVDHFDGIYYSVDHCRSNAVDETSTEPAHPYAPFLQALFLQRQYALQNNGTLLPIFKYSLMENKIEEGECFDFNSKEDRKKLKLIWTVVCYDFMGRAINTDTNDYLFTLSLDEIKSFSVYKTLRNEYALYNAPPDANYDSELRYEINEAIASLRQRMLIKHLEVDIQQLNANTSWLYEKQNYKLLLRRFESLSRLKDIIATELANLHLAKNLNTELGSYTSIIEQKKPRSRVIPLYLLGKRLGLPVQFIQERSLKAILQQFSYLFVLAQSHHKKKGDHIFRLLNVLIDLALGVEIDVKYLENNIQMLAIKLVESFAAELASHDLATIFRLLRYVHHYDFAKNIREPINEAVMARCYEVLIANKQTDIRDLVPLFIEMVKLTKSIKCLELQVIMARGFSTEPTPNKDKSNFFATRVTQQREETSSTTSALGDKCAAPSDAPAPN